MVAYRKREVDLGEGTETLYVFAPPWQMLSDVFAVDVRRHGQELRSSIQEVLDYEYDSAFFNGSVYGFSVYRDVTVIDRVDDETATVLAEVDTQRLQSLVGAYLTDTGADIERAEWEEDWNAERVK